MTTIGGRLRAVGLTPRALGAWSGASSLSWLPQWLAGLATPPLEAARALALLVGGQELSAGGLPPQLVDELVALGIIVRVPERGTLRAQLAVLPINECFAVCDRWDATDHEHLVAWPDDSSYHLVGALPERRVASWLDLGCGSAFAQLARPGLGERRFALDANPRAIALTQLGAKLAGVAIETITGDVATAPTLGERFHLITCNAPMVDGSAQTMWRRTDPAFFTRLWPAIKDSLAPDGLAIIHASRAMIPDDLPGERSIVRYSDFAVLWWRPDAATRVRERDRTLTPRRPHIDAADHAC